jgi:hypothetical protein
LYSRGCYDNLISIQNKLKEAHPLRNSQSIEILLGVIYACEYGDINKLKKFINCPEFHSLRSAERLYRRYLNGEKWYRLGRHPSDDYGTKLIISVLKLAIYLNNESANSITSESNISKTLCDRYDISFSLLSEAWDSLANNIDAEVDRAVSLPASI